MANPFDQVVEALGREYSRRRQVYLNAEGHWEGRPEPPDPDSTWEEAAEDWRDEIRALMRSYLQHALSTGLLKLVEERPEEQATPEKLEHLRRAAEVEVRRYESDLRKLAEDDSGHHPEGEPSEEALEEAQRAYDAPENSRCRMESALRTAYAIDHP